MNDTTKTAKQVLPAQPEKFTRHFFAHPQHVERRLLMLLLPIFSVACLSAWLISEFQGLSRWYEYAILAPASVVFAALLIWTIKCKPEQLGLIRASVLVVGPGVVLVRFAQLLLDLGRDGFDPSYYFGLSPWLILCCALFLFLLPSRMSWMFALGYYGLSVLMLGGFYLWNGNVLPSFVHDEFFLNVVIAPPVFIALMSAFTRLRADYVRARTQAEDLEEQALQDSLTGLHNRRAFSQSYRRSQARMVRNKTPLCAVLLDIDHFKRVNDTYGHQVGDDVLVKLAGVLVRELRGSDEVFRWGGEEFMLLLENTSLEAAIEVSERIRAAVEATALLDRSTITISLGVTDIQPGEAEDVIYPRADIALYTSKRDGRNRVSVEQSPSQVAYR